VSSSWTWRAFDDCVVDVTGGQPKTLLSEVTQSGRFPVVDQGKDMLAGYVDDEARLCRAELPVVVFGDHTRKFKFVDFPFCLGADGTKILKAIPGIEPRFLYRYLCTLAIGGDGYERHFKYLRRFSVPVPPISEQRCIAAILDQADALRAKRRQALSRLRSMSDAIFNEMFGNPIHNARRLPTAALPDVCDVVSGATPSKAEPGLWGAGFPWFSPKDLKKADLWDAEDHVTEGAVAAGLKVLPANSIAIVVRGMILAHTFPVCVLRVPATINQDVKGLVPREPMHPQFLAACLRSQTAHALSLVSTAGHGTKRFDQGAMRELRVFLADEAAQLRFVRAIDEVQASLAAATKSAGSLDAMFVSLQHRAFRGEL
jgi:type I restriction enzyme, S subunit